MASVVLGVHCPLAVAAPRLSLPKAPSGLPVAADDGRPGHADSELEAPVF